MIDLAIPSDLEVTLFFLAVSLIISIVVAFKKNIIQALIWMSILTNLNFLQVVTSNSRMFYEYNIQWMNYFSLFIWPAINIFLIVKYFRSRKNEVK